MRKYFWASAGKVSSSSNTKADTKTQWQQHKVFSDDGLVWSSSDWAHCEPDRGNKPVSIKTHYRLRYDAVLSVWRSQVSFQTLQRSLALLVTVSHCRPTTLYATGTTSKVGLDQICISSHIHVELTSLHSNLTDFKVTCSRVIIIFEWLWVV